MEEAGDTELLPIELLDGSEHHGQISSPPTLTL